MMSAIEVRRRMIEYGLTATRSLLRRNDGMTISKWTRGLPTSQRNARAHLYGVKAW